MLELPFDGNRVEPLADRLDPANQTYLVMPLRLPFHGRAHREDADAVLTKDLEQARIGDLALHLRTYPPGVKPLLERPAKGRVLGGEQERRTFQGLRKAAPVGGRQTRRNPGRHTALHRE